MKTLKPLSLTEKLAREIAKIERVLTVNLKPATREAYETRAATLRAALA